MLAGVCRVHGAFSASKWSKLEIFLASLYLSDCIASVMGSMALLVLTLHVSPVIEMGCSCTAWVCIDDVAHLSVSCLGKLEGIWQMACASSCA